MVQKLDKPALSKQWFLDVQWSDCPPEVEEVVKKLWRLYELGNDNYILQETINHLVEQDGVEVNDWSSEHRKWMYSPMDTKPLVEYLMNQGLKDDENVIIHWWW